MEKPKEDHSSSKLTVEQIVQKKLGEANEMLKRTDLSTLPRRLKAKQD